ncbi:MAG TPA: DEAD/DEAH box helicase, partial [Ignavibacteriaceae bacterium]|nr:DEAD/DEAH box helicase [Ignavibacteriaceae bacterium]
RDFILIADESHYAAAGSKSQRGKRLLAIAGSSFCRAAFLLTGTPMKNGRPINLFPLLQATKHELAKDSRYFHIHFCNAHPSTFTRWDVSGAIHLDELSEKIKNVMIRKTKKECLDLPEKIRVIRKAELSKESERLYNEALAEMKRKYQEKINSGEIVGGAEALVLLGQLAHAGAIGKVETALELAEEVIEEGSQVAIFCTYTKPLQMLAERLKKDNIPYELLIGDTKDRQGCVDRFLAKKSKVFLLSMAGGVGIDLYTATTIILINRPWTPGDVAQIEDRLHRIGQKNQVTSIWLQYGNVDEHVDEIIQSKNQNIDIVLKGRKQQFDSVNNYAKEYLRI